MSTEANLFLLTDGAAEAPRTLVLAHGAGAPMDSPFMAEMAAGLAGPELRVVRFEFPYMARRRQEPAQRPGPNPARVLQATWRSVIAMLGPAHRLVVGGKSMGGRIASMVADDAGVAGLVCLGYPFHPPGRPDRLRVEHLRELRTPTLVVQGERDALGTRDEVDGYGLSARIQVEWLPDGDHSFKPRVRSGHTLAENMTRARELVLAFLRDL